MMGVKLFIYITSLTLAVTLNGQVSIGSPSFNYVETFGSTGPASTWVNNSSYLGWYTGSASDYQGFENVTVLPPSNTGGLYTYQCNGGGDVKLGSKASSGTGIIRYGMRLVNNTGYAVSSISVSYDYYQMSLGQNGNNINTIAFSYLTGATVTNINSGGFTNFPALNFSQLQNSPINGSGQIVGYPCTQMGSVSSTCLMVSIPAGQEIMLRWTDVDDSGNDHHLAIDNVNVKFYTNNTVNPNTACSLLPLELIDFYGVKKNHENAIVWKMASSENVTHYEIEKSNDGIHFISLSTISAGNYYSINEYHIEDGNPYEDITYYRLTSHESDGQRKVYQAISVDSKQADKWDYVQYTKNDFLVIDFKNQLPQGAVTEVYDLSGKLISVNPVVNSKQNIDVNNLSEGIYFANIIDNNRTEHFKFIITK